MRSDNGGEYISKEFKELLTNHTIKHELTAPYSPHQNGTAERCWRTLFDMARSMLTESKLPKFLWTYAVMAATYTRNRCYNQRIMQTPYGLITGLKPDVSHLHLFGSVCYAYVQGHKKKLDARSKVGYFVGYDKESPAYLVFYPERNSVGKHRLVKFTDKFRVCGQDVDDAPDIHDAIPDEIPKKDIAEDEVPAEAPGGQLNDTDARERPGDDEIEMGRYPNRQTQRPSYLNDYVSEVIANDDQTFDYCYLMNAPLTYQDAMNSENSAEWINAMDEEIKSLKQNDTFLVTKLPPDRKVVGGRWVYAVKGNREDGTLYKARYVAKGYNQVHGIDYFETFSPTARMESVRILMQVSVQEKMLVHQMDVKSTYLHAPLECDIYVTQPEGYVETTADGNKLVWKLQRSLYGLKQSGRNWNSLLQEFLINNNFEQSTADPCVYVRLNEEGTVILLVWVDDIISAISIELTDVALQDIVLAYVRQVLLLVGNPKNRHLWHFRHVKQNIWLSQLHVKKLYT